MAFRCHDPHRTPPAQVELGGRQAPFPGPGWVRVGPFTVSDGRVLLAEGVIRPHWISSSEG